jgi:hypothetical protein
MTQFDITQFVEFKPPRYLCPRCASIWQASDQVDWPEKWWYDYDCTPEAWTCSVCDARFEATRICSDVGDYLKRWGCVLQFEDLANHLKNLSGAATELRSRDARSRRPRQSLRNLFAALNQARHFIHLLSTGLSWEFVGMLALLSHRVQVRGVVSRCQEHLVQKLAEARQYGAKDFDVIPLDFSDSDFSPHTKLIVIDGLLAIWGTANLTIQAWRNVDDSNEKIHVETRPEEVWELNNTYFSPVWSRLRPVANNVAPMYSHGPRWTDSLRIIDGIPL